MRVTEILSTENYWSDPRFQDKKPNLYYNWVAASGDNIYEPIAPATCANLVRITATRMDLAGTIMSSVIRGSREFLQVIILYIVGVRDRHFPLIFLAAGTLK